MTKPIFKADIDSGLKGGYPPYLITFLVIPFAILSAFGFISFSYNYSGKIMAWAVLGIFIIETIALQARLKGSTMTMIKADNRFVIQTWENKALTQTTTIKSIKYWWSYNFPSSNRTTSSFGYGDEYSSGNSSLKGTGLANEIILHVEIISKDNQILYLTEKKGNWADPPKEWEYSLNTHDNPIEMYRLSKLVKIIKADPAFNEKSSISD